MVNVPHSKYSPMQYIYSYLWKRPLYIDLEINLCNPGSMCVSESLDTGHSIYLRVTFLTFCSVP